MCTVSEKKLVSWWPSCGQIQRWVDLMEV